MNNPICSECNLLPTQHECLICKVKPVCPECCGKRGHDDLNNITCKECDENNKKQAPNDALDYPSINDIEDPCSDDSGSDDDGKFKLDESDDDDENLSNKHKCKIERGKSKSKKAKKKRNKKDAEIESKCLVLDVQSYKGPANFNTYECEFVMVAPQHADSLTTA